MSKKTVLHIVITAAAVLAFKDVYGAPENSNAGKELFAFRMLYAPGHFGNSYEVMSEQEMRLYLSEMKYWGFNHYGDWFDALDRVAPSARTDSGETLWNRKKANFRTASKLGFKCDFITTPNHGKKSRLPQMVGVTAMVAHKSFYGSLQAKSPHRVSASENDACASQDILMAYMRWELGLDTSIHHCRPTPAANLLPCPSGRTQGNLTEPRKSFNKV